MTTQEYRNALENMTDADFKKFKRQFGGEAKTREERVREYAQNPRHERLICYYLRLKTEEEKWTEAPQNSANAAGISAKAAASSAKTATTACAVCFAILVVMVIALFRNA